MGPCHGSTKLKSRESFKIQIEKSKIQIEQIDVSVSIQNLQFQPKINDEKQILENLQYFLSSDVGFKLRSGMKLETLLNQKKDITTMNDFMFIELTKRFFQKIKDQEEILKEYHRYVANIQQFLEIFKFLLNPSVDRLDSDKLSTFSNKDFPLIIFSKMLIIYHALIFHKSVLWVKTEDRWWAINKNEENFQSLVSITIEINGKIKYEYEPKIGQKQHKNSILNSKIFSINSHEEQMKKSNNSKSNESKTEKIKKESDFYYLGANTHFNDIIFENEEVKPKVLEFQRGRSSEEIVAKYKTHDEIVEENNDEEIKDGEKDLHRAKDCYKYMFTMSPMIKSSGFKDKGDSNSSN